MSMKNLMMTMVAVLLCSCATAQSRIDRIVEELEQKGVDVSKVVKRDPKTKQVYSVVKSLSFYSKDGKYANRLKEAFGKEAENAVSETVGNRGNSSVLVFRDGKKKYTYSLHISPRKDKDPEVSLSIIFKDGSVRVVDEWDFSLSGSSLDGLDVLGSLDGLDSLTFIGRGAGRGLRILGRTGRMDWKSLPDSVRGREPLVIRKRYRRS